MNNFFYFDNAATTKVLPEAATAALNCMNKNFANPSALYKFGLEAEQTAQNAKKTIAQVLNCSPVELIFTPSATISTNIALLGSLNFKKLSKLNKTKIITTQIEHASTRNCLNNLEKQGFTIVQIPPRCDHIYHACDFAEKTDESVCLISIMHVNNENGLILPIEQIAKLCKQKNNSVLIHLDCVQSFAKMPINLSNIPADFVSISGHKINAPKGVGALFIKKHTSLSPIIFGGGQQNKLCPGTENIPAIAGFDIAAKFHSKNIKKHFKHYKALQTHLTNLLTNGYSQKLFDLNFNADFNAPHIFNISIRGIRSHIMLNFLESKGFIVASGSACSKGKTSTILQNLGYGFKNQDSAIRISFSFENTIEQINELAKAILQGAKTIEKTN